MFAYSTSTGLEDMSTGMSGKEVNHRASVGQEDNAGETPCAPWICQKTLTSTGQRSQ